MSGVNRQVLFSCLQADLASYQTAGVSDPWSDWKAIAVAQLLDKVLSKYEDPNPRADAAAVAKFRATNERVGTWRLELTSSWDEQLYGSFRKALYEFCETSGGDWFIRDYAHIFEMGDIGPGANLLGVGGDFYSKFFSSSLSSSDLSLYATYRSILWDHPLWYRAEHSRLLAKGPPKVVEGSRISCVPKNVNISRTICTEPTLNMWFQLGVGNIIRRRLGQVFGLDLETVADVNRELARQGSIDDSEDSFVTIDLESASDSISLSLVDACLPSWFAGILRDLRCGEAFLPSGERVQLNMVSTMGNGYTFPLQTLIFSCVVAAVYGEMGIPHRRLDHDCPNWSVFGDDIIVVRKAYKRVVHLLGILGFVVNKQKSFFEGPFRESCGYDFYKGRFVRPVYLKHLDTQQDVFLAFNKFVRWGTVMGIGLPVTLRYLLGKARFQPVPPWESDDAGFKVPLWFATNVRRTPTGVLRYFASCPNGPEMRLLDESVEVPRGQRSRVYNPDGLLIAITKGVFGGGRVVLRHRIARYTTRRRVALNWETPPLPIESCGPMQIIRGKDPRFAKDAARRHASQLASWFEGRRWESVFWALAS